MARRSPSGGAQGKALKHVAARFCLVDLGGEIRVADRQQIADVLSGKKAVDVSLYKRSDGNTLLRRYLENLAVPDDPSAVISQFWVDPGTHVYTSFAFSPMHLPPDVLNYWSGPTATPSNGNWTVMSAFLREIICGGDQSLYMYLIRYLAQMLQKPEDKPGVMIVMLGGQGTGKGTFFALLRSIWSRTTLQVSDVDEVVGRFNGALERNFAICMDEALFSGDKKSMERLKSLITEPKCRIEQKYQPARSIDSYHRFFAASNNDHFAHVDRDDRRFLFLRVSDRRQGDHGYWKALHASLADPAVVGSMVRDLLSMQLANFNVRLRPRSEEHLNQKLQSLAGFERFWLEVLQKGGFEPRLGVIETWSAPRFIGTQTLLEGFKMFDRQSERYRPTQARQIGQVLSRWCPAAKSTRRMVRSVDQERGYDLPSLKAARREFELAVDGCIDWGEPERRLVDDDELEALWEGYELSGGCYELPE